MNLDELNRGQRLANFPPEKRWEAVEGAYFQPLSSHEGGVLFVSGRDHTGAEVKFWTNLPNAMYLLNMLAQIQKDVRAQVPSNPPAACKPYDGGT
jgi:hypothetical protein